MIDVDQRVVARARQGDHGAFRELVGHYDAGLRALAYRLLGDRHRMDDVLQDAYLKAYRALPSFRGDASPGTWLYRITYNACIDELRRRRNVVQLPLERAEDHPDPHGDVGARAGDRAVLAQALDTLPPDQRAVVLLVDAKGFDYADAAAVLGIPEGTVRSRLSRARARLRRALGAGREGVSDVR